MMLSRAPVSFKSRAQSLTAMPTMEAELVASALAIKEAVFCSNMLTELLRGDIVNGTYGAHKHLYIKPFLLTIFGPITYGPP